MKLTRHRTTIVARRSNMSETDETRFEIIKEILTEFPTLREKVLKWLQETEPPKKP
jgi:predicted patatin/cPLA2 family phospholipase